MAQILMTWVIGGIATILSITLVEFAAITVRGPEYMVWLQQNLPKSKERSEWVWLFYFGTWPIWCGVLLYAGLVKGETFLEYHIKIGMKAEEAKEKDNRDMLKRRRESALKLKDATHVWVPQAGDANALQVVYRGDDQTVVAMVTHLIIPSPSGVDGFLGYRMIESHWTQPIPFDVDDDMTKLKETCEKDVEWQMLCLPGMQGDQETAYRTSMDHLDEKVT